MDFKKQTKPHDHFFRVSMRRKDIAKYFLRTFIDPDIVKSVDFSTFEISKESWVDTEFSEHFADIVYHAQLKSSNGSLYFLFEHKSFIDKNVFVQNLYYMDQIWDQIKEQRQHRPKLPLILSIIVYNGVKTWNVSNSTKSLFEIPKGADKYLPDYQSIVIDLNTVNENKAGKSILLKTFIIALKYAQSKEILQKLPEIIQLFEGVGKARQAYLSLVLVYIGSVIPVMEHKKFMRILVKEYSKGILLMNDVFEALRKKGFKIGARRGREEGEKLGIAKGEKLGIAKGEKLGKAKGEKLGIKKGRLEGVKEGKILVVKKMLLNKKNAQEIHKLTGVPVNQIKSISRKTSTTTGKKLL